MNGSGEPIVMGTEHGALVSTLSLRPLLVELQRRGLDPEALLNPRAITAADVTEPLTRVPESVLWQIWADAVRLTGDAALGIDVGCHFEPQSLGMLGHIIANTATIRESVAKWQEFTALIDDQPYIHLQDQGACVRLEFRRRADIDPEQNRALVEFASFSVLRLLGYLLGRGELLSESVHRMCFRHAQPPEAQLSAYRSRLGKTELAFGQAANAIELDASVLDQPVVYADPQVLELMAERARQQLRNQHRGHFVVLRVQQVIRQRLADPTLTLPEVAAELAMSRSTLQRQLKDAGVSFRGLLAEIRQQRACEMLGDGAPSVDALALALGYSEPAAFIHAFKAWTGQTPSAWRRSHSQ